MCTTCGCGSSEVRVDGAKAGAHAHEHPDGTVHAHAHGHDGRQAHGPLYRSAAHGIPGVLGAVHAPHVGAARIVEVERDLLAKNDAFAAQNRRRCTERGILALNLVSSPGSGKTTLLVRTIEAWAGRTLVFVIEGDQQTSRDADRVRATGVAAVQINTGKGCHLDAHMVGHAIERLEPAANSVLLIENVGNLVCPAAFDLGEAHKVAILSVTEGEDKPLKYPDLFAAADLVLINKVDLLPYVPFDVERAIAYARQVRPDVVALRVSALTGEGMDRWIAWLEREAAAARSEARSIEAAAPEAPLAAADAGT